MAAPEGWTQADSRLAGVGDRRGPDGDHCSTFASNLRRAHGASAARSFSMERRSRLIRLADGRCVGAWTTYNLFATAAMAFRARYGEPA